MRDGTKIRICDMDNTHLYWTLRMVDRVLKRQWVFDCGHVPDDFEVDPYLRQADMYDTKISKALMDEAQRRGLKWRYAKPPQRDATRDFTPV